MKSPAIAWQLRALHMTCACLLAALASSVARAADAPKKPAPSKPSSHTVRTIEGWQVRIDDRLLAPPDDALGARALRFLEYKLADINAVVAPEPLAKLHAVTIVLDLVNGTLGVMQYHPDAGWLEEHGYSKDLAKCVHIPEADDLATPRNITEQPWVVLHELAHAYHDQVLGFEEPRIVKAYEEFKKSGHGDRALLYDGTRVRHYGLTDQKEFFAEMTESYFGLDDFFPFNRAELMTAEPAIFELMQAIWGPVAGGALKSVKTAVPKGAWTVISDRLLADLEKAGAKPQWPGKTTGVVADRTGGDAFVLVPGRGVWRTADKGATFARIDGGVIGGRCETGWSVNMDPGGRRMVCFMLDGPSGYTLDGGATWTGLAPMGRGWDFGAVDWTSAQPATIFAARHECGGEYYMSGDFGKTWKMIGTDPKIEGVGVADAGTLLLCRGRGIERSTDGGATWTKVSDLQPKSRVATLFKGRVYWVGAAGLIVSKDKGATWETQGAAVDAAMGPFFGNDERHAVVVGKKGFFETVDGGATWTHVAPMPEPECRVDWFGNFAWDPAGDVFYFANMGKAAWSYARRA